MRGADDPALATLMARATASDKIIDRINRRRRRAQVEPAVGAHHEIRLRPIHYEITPVCPKSGVAAGENFDLFWCNNANIIRPRLKCERERRRYARGPPHHDGRQSTPLEEGGATRRSTLSRHGHSRERTTRP